MEDFYHDFKREENSIRDTLTSISTNGILDQEKVERVKQCDQQITALCERVRSHSSSLTARDQSSYSTALRSLTVQLQSIRNAVAPKRKFGFKKAISDDQPRGSELSNPQSGDNQEKPPTPSQYLPSESLEGVLKLSDLKSTIYRLPGVQAGEFRAVSIERITGSVVDISSRPPVQPQTATIMLQEGRHSLFLFGSVTGSCHVTGLQACAVVVKCRQFRMHSCKNCVIYLHCGSRPIIEDCHDVRFGALPASDAPNLWNQVDDFSWLRGGHNPNWRELEADDRYAIDAGHLKEMLSGSASDWTLEDFSQRGKIDLP